MSFLGLGDPNVACWGRLVGEGRPARSAAPGTSAPFPGVAIMVTVLCLNLIGDGLNDALNPQAPGPLMQRIPLDVEDLSTRCSPGAAR